MNFPKPRIAVVLPAAVAAAVLSLTACNPKQVGIPTAHHTGTASPAAHRRHHRDPAPSASPSPSPSGTFPAGLTAKEKRLIIKVRDHLRSVGMTEHLSNAEVGTLGHAVCVARRNGVSESQVADAGNLAGAKVLFDLSPAIFAKWAEQAICPQWAPKPGAS